MHIKELSVDSKITLNIQSTNHGAQSKSAIIQAIDADKIVIYDTEIDLNDPSIYIEMTCVVDNRPMIWHDINAVRINLGDIHVIIISQTSDGKICNQRNTHRIILNTEGRVRIGLSTEYIPCTINDLSLSGFALTCEAELSKGDYVRAKVTIDNEELVLTGFVIRKLRGFNNSNTYGFSASNQNHKLNDFITMHSI